MNNNKTLKIRVIKVGEKYFPQYKWESLDSSESYPKKEFNFNNIFEDILGFKTQWSYMFDNVGNPISFNTQVEAVKHATDYKNTLSPIVVWEG